MKVGEGDKRGEMDGRGSSLKNSPSINLDRGVRVGGPRSSGSEKERRGGSRQRKHPQQTGGKGARRGRAAEQQSGRADKKRGERRTGLGERVKREEEEVSAAVARAVAGTCAHRLSS